MVGHGDGGGRVERAEQDEVESETWAWQIGPSALQPPVGMQYQCKQDMTRFGEQNSTGKYVKERVTGTGIQAVFAEKYF
jgi:hypothetical protein